MQSLYVGPSKPFPSWLPLEGTAAIAHTSVVNASEKMNQLLQGSWEYGWRGEFSFQRKKKGDMLTNLILAFESKREGADADANELARN